MAVTLWRFIDSPTLSAYENMEIDSSLLKSSEPTFRLYSWKKNSFTIGRSQKIGDIEDTKRLGSNWAQRPTGGGVLLHGFDLSYAIAIPTKMLKERSVKESYEYLCSFLLHFYRGLGLHVEYAKNIDLPLSKSQFCQVGFEPYDIVYQGKKLGGNAQKRTKNTILQHGSIPLKKDDRAYAGHSLEELGLETSLQEVKKMLKESFIDLIHYKLI